MGKGSPTLEQQQELSSSELAALYTADTYVCTLSPELKKIAKKELREDDKTREQAIDQMRQWITKTSYIKDCRLDSNFILRFLRHKKFSVPMAQETLLKYIVMRQQYPGYYYETSTADPMVLDLINRGIAFPLPKRDKLGRRVLFTVGGNIDPHYHTTESVVKVIMVLFESLLENEEDQIRGFSYILDEGAITLTHLTNLWNPTEMTRIIGTCEKALPMRHKKLDFISLPTLFTYVFEFFKSLMSPKIRNRIALHKDSKSIKEHVDEKILPKEYGGEMSMKEMIDVYKQDIIDKQGRLRALDRMCVDLDAMKKSTTISATAVSKDIMGMTGSFKKLEFD